MEDVNERDHKANCERSFTLMHKNFNCVLSINMQDRGKEERKHDDVAPISISDLD